MLNVKEIVIGATAVVGVGIGVVNLVSTRKNKKNVSALEQKVIELEKRPMGFYTQDMWGGGFQNPQQPTAVAVPKE